MDQHPEDSSPAPRAYGGGDNVKDEGQHDDNGADRGPPGRFQVLAALVDEPHAELIAAAVLHKEKHRRHDCHERGCQAV